MVSDVETGLFQNFHRDYNAAIGGYIESNLIGLRGGVNGYVYVLNNPLSYTDPFGLEVYVCSQPAFGWMPVDHQWIKTDSVEAGMGGARGNVPGNQSGDTSGNYTYNAAGNQMFTRRGVAVTVDAAGNITSDGIRSYTYNQAGQLSQLRKNNVLLASYFYNYKGERTRKVTTAAAPQGGRR